MYTEKDLQREISEIVNGRIEQRVSIPADAITLMIIGNHMEGFVRGEGWLAMSVWGYNRKAVGNYLARIAKDEQGDMRQLRMPGFEHLQRYYVIKRGQDDMAVPIGQLSIRELRAIKTRLLKEGAAKRRHADEIEEYIDSHFSETM